MTDTITQTRRSTYPRRDAETRFRLGDCLVVPEEGAILRGADIHRIEPRVMDVLVRLCLAGGEVLSAEQLLTEIWRGTFYGDNPVHKAIAQIRKALGDTIRTPRYIATVRKRGYRVLVPVRVESVHGIYAPSTTPTWSGGSPFRGLRPFEGDHADVFFGRDDAIGACLEALMRQRQSGAAVLLVIGRSGSGKSSLLHAGLLPALCLGHDDVHVESSARMAIEACIVPALASALCGWTLAGRAVFHSTERESLEHCIEHDPEMLLPRIDAALERARHLLRKGSSIPSLALLLDPLEALLGDDIDVARLSTFDRAVSVLAKHRHVMVIAACRVDFYPILLERLPLLATLKGGAGHFDLRLLGPGELAMCVRGPAHAAGLAFERDVASQERLDDRLIDDAQRSSEMLPMLQYVLDQLFDARLPDGTLTFAAYRGIGGLSGAIANRAEAAIETLDAQARAALPDVFSMVCALRPESDVLVGRAARWSDIEGSASERLVNTLLDARLFASESSPGGRVFRVAHEALLRQWPRAAEWSGRNRIWLQLHDRVRAAALRWSADSRRPDLLWRSWRLASEANSLRAWRPQRLSSVEQAFISASSRIARRQRWLMASIAVTVLSLAVASGILAVREHHARIQADARRSQAERLLDFALGDLADRLRPIARLDLLQSVAQQALIALTDPDAQFDGPSAVLQRVRALRTSAEVLLEQGDLDDGERALVEAIGLVDGEAGRDIGASQRLYEGGQLAYWRGLVEFRRKRLDRAAPHWQRYSDDAAALALQQPDEPKWILERSYALNNLGTLEKGFGRWSQAIDAFQASISLKRKYLEAVPGDANARTDLADSVSWLADTLERQGKPRDALLLAHEQWHLLSETRPIAPHDNQLAHKVALADLRLGLLFASVGEVSSSIEHLRGSTARLAALAAHDPTNRTWLRDEANSRLQLGWILYANGEGREGDLHIGQARDVLRALVTLAAPPAEWQRLLALAELRAWRSQGSPAALAPDVGRAVERLRKLHLVTPTDNTTHAVLAWALLAYGDAQAATGNREAAHTLWREATSLALVHADIHAPDRITVEVLASGLARIGDPEHRRWLDALAAAGFAHPAFSRELNLFQSTLSP